MKRVEIIVFQLFLRIIIIVCCFAGWLTVSVFFCKKNLNQACISCKFAPRLDMGIYCPSLKKHELTVSCIENHLHVLTNINSG